MRPVYIATAYLGPIQQYCKMLQYPEVRIETAENYVKQTYRKSLFHRRRERPTLPIHPHRQARYLEMPDQGHPYLRPRKLAAPTLERFGIGLQYESVFRVLCR